MTQVVKRIDKGALHPDLAAIGGVQKAPLPPEGSGLSTQSAPELDDVIKNIVAQKVAEAMAALVHTGGTQEHRFPKVTEKGVQPDQFLKHYRCDVHPNLSVQEVDMEMVNSGVPRGQAAKKGNWLQFRQGHFYATTKNQVDQLEWMMKHQPTDPTDSTVTIGGNRSIYEHDGGDIYRCPTPGCEFISASKNGINAHRRATHGEDV